MKLNYGTGDGAVGKAGHAKLRAMTLNQRSLGYGQDMLREQLSRVTTNSGGTSNRELEHDPMPPAKARISGHDPKGRR